MFFCEVEFKANLFDIGIKNTSSALVISYMKHMILRVLRVFIRVFNEVCF